ncbi:MULTISPECIES: hypothetical protein [Paenibacillus]|uniref:hypothetical protein n=1 Tax=Paenibacillus TaxID=44249 RepID=UPI002FE28274
MGIKKQADKQETLVERERTFSKAQFLAARRFSGVEKDILQVVLEDGAAYTEAEAEQAVQSFIQRGVKEHG